MYENLVRRAFEEKRPELLLLSCFPSSRGDEEPIESFLSRVREKDFAYLFPLIETINERDETREWILRMSGNPDDFLISMIIPALRLFSEHFSIPLSLLAYAAGDASLWGLSEHNHKPLFVEVDDDDSNRMKISSNTKKSDIYDMLAFHVRRNGQTPLRLDASLCDEKSDLSFIYLAAAFYQQNQCKPACIELVSPSDFVSGRLRLAERLTLNAEIACSSRHQRRSRL